MHFLWENQYNSDIRKLLEGVILCIFHNNGLLRRCKFWQLNLAVLWLAPFSLLSVVNIDFHFQDCDYYLEQSLKLYYKRNNTKKKKRNEVRIQLYLTGLISRRFLYFNHFCSTLTRKRLETRWAGRLIRQKWPQWD